MSKTFLNLICVFVLSIMSAQSDAKKKGIINYYTSRLELINQKKYQKGLELLTLGLEQSQKIEDKNLTGYGYFYVAEYHQKKKTYLQGIEPARKSLPIFKALKNE
jgi:hypothetical protein